MNQYNKDSAPFFILGTQRSGTTLLARILSAHPEVFVQNEISVHAVFEKAETAGDIWKNISEEIQKRHKLSTEALMISLNKRILGVKDPQLTEYIEKLELFSDNSKFIIIIRDARAVVNSYKKNKWGLGTNAYTGAIRWNNEVRAQLNFYNNNKKNCLIVRYEYLLSNLKECIKDICSHIGVDFNDKVLEYHVERPLYKQNKSNINADRNILKENANKWADELSRHEVNVIENVCGLMLSDLDYELRGEVITIPRWLKAYYMAQQYIIGGLQLQWQWRISVFRQLFNSKITE